MFFTRFGTVVAWLLLGLCAFRVGTAIFIINVTNTPESFRALSERYLGTATTGEAFNQLPPILGFAIAIGILSEISKAVRR